MDDRSPGGVNSGLGEAADATQQQPPPRVLDPILSDDRMPPPHGISSRRMKALWPRREVVAGLVFAAALFLAAAALFFLVIGRNPGPLFVAMAKGAFGGWYALSETLVKTAPILLCALATVLPARLGLVSVGAEGQLFMGALAGTAFVLHVGAAWGALTLPGMLISAAVGGAAWAALAGVLRVCLLANETICTLLLNYISPLLVDFLVYGPWKDPQSLGWPATVSFPQAALLPTFFGSRVHLGLLLGIGLVALAHMASRLTRWGFYLDLLKGSPPLAARAGLRFAPAVVVVMALGGACAGLAGIGDASAVEGRLQSGVAAGAGYGGFLVAWLARGQVSVWRLLPLSLLIAALNVSGDSLQLFADLPSSITFVLQGLLFASALVVDGLRRRSDSAPGRWWRRTWPRTGKFPRT